MDSADERGGEVVVETGMSRTCSPLGPHPGRGHGHQGSQWAQRGLHRSSHRSESQGWSPGQGQNAEYGFSPPFSALSLFSFLLFPSSRSLPILEGDGGSGRNCLSITWQPFVWDEHNCFLRVCAAATDHRPQPAADALGGRASRRTAASTPKHTFQCGSIAKGAGVAAAAADAAIYRCDTACDMLPVSRGWFGFGVRFLAVPLDVGYGLVWVCLDLSWTGRDWIGLDCGSPPR